MVFTPRPPSTAWEPVSLSPGASSPVWLWWSPAGAPHTFLAMVPQATQQSLPVPLSLRGLLQAIAVPAEAVGGWTLGGMTFPSDQGRNPLLDQPLPAAPPQGLTLTVHLAMPGPAPSGFPVPVPAAAVAAAVLPAGGLVESIDANWQAIVQLERNLESVRKQLGAAQARLQSLNRDLGPEERRFADNADRKDWQDARRWLRDAASHVSRFIRDHDIGSVSSAGRRTRLAELHQQVVEQRQASPGLEGIALEFEQHRKTAQSLLTQMQSVQSSASRDAEQRAQQVLSRIAAKVRSARSQR